MRFKRGRGVSPLLGGLVFVVLGAVAVTGFAITRSAARHQERTLLHERTTEVAAILATSGSLASSLRMVGEVHASGDSSAPAFGAAARTLLSPAAPVVGVAKVVGDKVIVQAVEGKGLEAGAALTGELEALVRRALAADGLVSTLKRGAQVSMLTVGIQAPKGSVVFEESLLPTKPASANAESPFQELDAVLYRTPKADPANLLIATTDRLPLMGPVESREITFGSETWLIQTSARTPLISAQTRAVPWIILGTGLAAALVAAGVISLLLRRRAYALALVEQRTVELRQAVADLEVARSVADMANKAKSQFLSRMSHELRTPLNAVLGFAQLLELDERSPEDSDAISHILKGGNHLLDLINEVLDISRIESGDLALSPESVLATDIVTESLDLMRPLAAARSIHIVADRQSTCMHYVFADRQRLKQILLNLLSNAVKYNRVGGTVTVTCEQMSGTRLRLKVADTGAGISAENTKLLFVPFERLDANLTDVEGTGIGLALARRLAEAMGGTLDVESTVGVGSTFWVELPLVEGAVERYDRLSNGTPATADAVQLLPEAHRVLYIEDNLANITLVQRILGPRGDIELLPAMQGRLGVELAVQHQPALILLDLHLPDIPGEEVLQLLRDDPATSAIPVIVVSADATTGQVQRLKAAGATAYLTKPFDVRELIGAIAEALGVSDTVR